MERVVVKSAPSQLFHVCLGAQPFSGKPCHSENVVRPRRQVVTKARLDVASSATAKLCSRLPLTPFQPYPLRTPLGRRQTVCQASERDDADVTIGAQFVPHVEKPPFLSKAAELLKFRAFGGDEAAAGRMRRFSRVAIATLALAVLGGQAALASSPASAPAPPAPAASVGDAVPGDAAGGTMFDAKPSAGSRFAYELRRLLNQGVELAPEMSYSGLWHAIGQKEVKAVVFLPTNYHLLAVMSDGREQVVAYPPDPDLLRHLADNEVAIGGVLPNRWVNSIFGVLRATFPFVMLVTMSELYFRVDRKKAPKWVETEDISDLYSGEPPKNRLTAAWTKQKQANKRKSTKVTLNDIAGLDAIIDEIRELLYLMNNTQEVLALGVSKIPTGVLLVGRPGCGKTLLARAIAGETSRAFITAAGTQFTDMFIGSGASRVAALFAKARYYAPCTVFIDEFDAMAQQRGSSPARDAATAEKESTVNQLLVELDGFLERSDVVVLAATNRPSVLDKAVIRAGRFDKTIAIPPPDMIGREAILKVHARSKNMATDVDWREIAYRTGGMSGADLANLLNEAGFDAVRLNTKAITTTNVLNALDKVKDMFDDRDPAQAAMAAAAKAVAGGGSAAGKLSPSSSAPLEEDEPGATLTAADKRMLATYQAGKALLGVLHREFDDLSKVVVAPSGKAVGYTVFLPQEKYLTTAGHITKR
eukprot:jgi/Mesvir1/17744/Mv05599-RA.2